MSIFFRWNIIFENFHRKRTDVEVYNIKRAKTILMTESRNTCFTIHDYDNIIIVFVSPVIFNKQRNLNYAPQNGADHRKTLLDFHFARWREIFPKSLYGSFLYMPYMFLSWSKYLKYYYTFHGKKVFYVHDSRLRGCVRKEISECLKFKIYTNIFRTVRRPSVHQSF